MSNFKRYESPGSTWFFTVVTYQRRNFLCDDRVRLELREAVRKVQAKYPFRVEAWVLLPDHFHCIWALPDQDSNFQLRIRLLKSYLTRSCSNFLHVDSLSTVSRRKRKESTVWQRRYWEHQIRSDRDFKHHMDYIHYNPVKHGLCHSPIEWPYSTVHSLTRRGIYPEAWALDPENKINANHNFGEST